MSKINNLETKSSPAVFALLGILIAVTLACGIFNILPQTAPTATVSPTQTPKIGEGVFGVECQPAVLDMLHGETKEIVVVDAGGEGRVTDFKTSSIVGPADDPSASEIDVSQAPVPNENGWSALPGTIRIHSIAVHGPPHTKTYNLNILLGGIQEGNFITGGNILCVVNVQHVDLTTATLTPTFTPTITPTMTVTPTPTIPPTRTPEKIRPTLYVNSPVTIGDTLIVKGLNFPPGEASKWLINPKGKILSVKDAPIPDTGSFSAPFPISGPVGIWTVVVKYTGGQTSATFEVIK